MKKLKGGLVIGKKLHDCITLEIGEVMIRLDIRYIEGNYVGIGILADPKKVKVNRLVDRGYDEDSGDGSGGIYSF